MPERTYRADMYLLAWKTCLNPLTDTSHHAPVDNPIRIDPLRPFGRSTPTGAMLGSAPLSRLGRRRLYLRQQPIERQSRHAKITIERSLRTAIEVSTSGLEKFQGDRHGKIPRSEPNTIVPLPLKVTTHTTAGTRYSRPELMMSLRRPGGLDQLVGPVSLIAEGQAANSFAGLRIVTNGSMPYFTKCLIHNACVQIKVFLSVNYIPIHQL